MTIKRIEKKWFKNPKFPYSSDTITSMTDDTGHNVDIAFILGGRNYGKSFEICAKRCLLEAWTSQGKRQFGYIRRYDKEMTAYSIEQYFADKCEFIKDITGGLYEKVVYYRHKLYFAHTYIDEKTEKTITEKSFEIGYTFALTMSTQYKSLQFPFIDKLLFEEVFADYYIDDECKKLINLISTVRRSKTKFITYLVANTVSRVNPYVNDLCLTNINRQKSGTIDTYKMYDGTVDKLGNDNYLFIAVEYLADRNVSKRRSVKTVASTISNKWDENVEYPTLPPKLAHSFVDNYSAVFEFGEFRFLCKQIDVPTNIQEYINADDMSVELVDEKMSVLYIEKKTTAIKPFTRVFTNKAVVNPNTTRGAIATNDNDKQMFYLINIGWVFFSDNLTGNEFIECYKKMHK